MKTQTENVLCVYEGKKLVAIIKRDEDTGHKLTYITGEADVEEIENLINPDKTLL